MTLANFGPFDGGFGAFELLFGLAWVAFWVAVVFLIVGAVRRGGGRPQGSSAVRLLEERYARGEIDRDEFFERRRVLRGEPPATGEPGPP
ncbi:MAG: SHOCT domain-containing protein [Actinomycetota bacterium]